MATTRKASWNPIQPASLEPILIGFMPVSFPGDSFPVRMGGVFPSQEFTPEVQALSGEKISDGRAAALPGCQFNPPTVAAAARP